MKANRAIYVSFDRMIIVTLWVCISIEIVSLFLDNELFNFGAKLSIIFGLLLLIICVKRGVGGYPAKIFTVLFILFFVQRIILLSIDPDNFVYAIKLYESDINNALLYLFYSIIAILLGFSFGIALSSMKRSRGQSYLNYGIFKKNSYRDKWIKISYVILFLNYFILLYLKQGFGVVPPGEYSWMLRPMVVAGLMFMVSILLLTQSDIMLSDYEKKALKIFIILSIGSFIISGSRGAFLTSLLYVFFTKCITGDMRVKAKTLILLSLMIPFLTVYVAVINFYRNFQQASFLDPSVTMGSIIDYNYLLDQMNPTIMLNFYSRRMNGFDYLVSALKKQEELSSHASIKYEVLRGIDSLYPGSLFEHGTDPGLWVPEVLRNIDMSTHTYFKETLDLISMSLIFFGYLGGPIYLFIFFFITALILFSKVGVVTKLIITNILILQTFGTGFFSSLFKNLSELLGMYVVVVILIRCRW